MGVTCACSLFQIIKHISTGLYVYELSNIHMSTKKSEETENNDIIFGWTGKNDKRMMWYFSVSHVFLEI